MSKLEMIAKALDYAINYPLSPSSSKKEEALREAIFWNHYAWLLQESTKK